MKGAATLWPQAVTLQKLIMADGSSHPSWLIFTFESVSASRACPKCASLCTATYDHRWHECLDALLRDRKVRLRIVLRRRGSDVVQRIYSAMGLTINEDEIGHARAALVGILDPPLTIIRAETRIDTNPAENSVSHQERKLIVTSQFPSTQPRKE
jgi:hypothetical protein